MMCGRFVQISRRRRLEQMFGMAKTHGPETSGTIPLYNVAPSMAPTVCLNSDWGSRELWGMYWGLRPSFAESEKFSYNTINARAETIATSRVYATPFRRRRCLIPVDGFYEWKGAKAPRQPYYVRMKNEAPFALAGVWDRWERPEKKQRNSFAIVTTTANELMTQIHDRMPVIIPPAQYDRWLDPALQDVDALLPLLVPYPAAWMTAYPVSKAVNTPKNNGPELIQPLPADQAPLDVA